MKSLPKWLSQSYSKLYVEKGKKGFTFQEAMNVLNKERDTVLKILSNLIKMGWLISRRSTWDERKKEYILIQPEDAHFVEGIQAKLQKRATFEDKVREMGKHLPYLVGGEYAVSLYTNWLFTKERKLLVNEKDLLKWYTYLKDPRTLVVVEPPTMKELEKHTIYIELESSPSEDELKEKRVLNDLNIITPENLILEMVEGESESSLQNGLAVAVVQRNELDWNRLERLSKKRGLNREVGFLFDALNSERRVFSKKNLVKFLPKSTQTVTPFPKKIKEKVREMRIGEYTEPYKELGEKWGLQSYLPKSVVIKIVEDLL